MGKSVLVISAIALLFGQGLGARFSSHKSAALSSSSTGFASSMFSEGPNFKLGNAIDQATKHMDFSHAAAEVKQRSDVPADVLSLVEMKSSALDDTSIGKARDFLNGLVVANYRELDAEIIYCKEFELRNRGTYDQVMADISRLSAQIADHMSKAAGAVSCISSVSTQMDGVREEMSAEHDVYLNGFNKNNADLKLKQNDLDVFNFLIQTMKEVCTPQSLLQEGAQAAPMQVCSSNGDTSLHFKDHSTQAKFNRVLTKGTKGLLRNALASLSAHPLSFLQLAQPVPVQSGVDEIMGELRCGDITDCWKVYDTISLEWGSYKDLVDELKKEMTDNQADWLTLKGAFEAQIESLVAASDKCTQQLADATAAKNGDEQLRHEKEEKRRVLNTEHKNQMHECYKNVDYIFGHICAFIVVRNQVTDKSSDCKSEDIDDCDVTGWTPDACSVECDDACPMEGLASETQCGGRQRLTRQVLQQNDACGFGCPALNSSQKCNQVRCPIDCEMSRWSGFSKCSKDCEGGIEAKTRSVVVKPKHGGRGCSVVSVARPCNTGSCDRDCELSSWESWGPCSQACDGGNQQRMRKVLEPIRANGKCPRATAPERLENQDCNTHACAGDEICIAEQDLIISVDSSGSVPAAHWTLVKNFTGELLKRYKSQYYAIDTMRIGLIQFGNGAVMADGTVAKAKKISALVSDIDALKTAASTMAHLKGFTNMAQGFVLAEQLLQKLGRSDAQFAVMTISDGVPSFRFQTVEKAKELETKGIQKFMVAVSEFPGSDSFKLMRDMASQPWETNVVRVPGWSALEDGGEPFVKAAIIKFCPDAMSPSLVLADSKSEGYILVREKGYCGGLGRTLSENTRDPQKCYELAQAASATGFSMGRRYRKGRCCVETLAFSADEYTAWQTGPENPACASAGGGFHKSRYFDWYAIQPTV